MDEVNDLNYNVALQMHRHVFVCVCEYVGGCLRYSLQRYVLSQFTHTILRGIFGMMGGACQTFAAY